MRKVIAYIASHFRKDKIWLRRSRPDKRRYQVRFDLLVWGIPAASPQCNASCPKRLPGIERERRSEMDQAALLWH